MKNKIPALYSDLDLSLTPHPLTGDLVPKVNESAIHKSIRNLVFMNAMDIPFERKVMKSIKRYLFEPETNITTSSIEGYIEWLLKAMEKRIEVKNVLVNLSQSFNGYIINIEFLIKSIRQDSNLEIHIQRKR